jgi:hypothetical protein
MHSQKNLDAFSKELLVKDMDVNQPTPNGRLPLIEAVKTKVGSKLCMRGDTVSACMGAAWQQCAPCQSLHRRDGITGCPC